MSFISNHVRQQIERTAVKVFFVSGSVAKWYNAGRSDKKTQVALLGGWYWSLGRTEYGPFRTASGAYRDFWYRHVCNTAPPALSERDVKRAQKEIGRIVAKALRPRLVA